VVLVPGVSRYQLWKLAGLVIHPLVAPVPPTPARTGLPSLSSVAERAGNRIVATRDVGRVKIAADEEVAVGDRTSW